jgi:hypothetical protein
MLEYENLYNDGPLENMQLRSLVHVMENSKCTEYVFTLTREIKFGIVGDWKCT